MVRSLFCGGGIQLLADDPPSLLLTALIFGLVNALIRPVLVLLTCPLQLITLGLFTFVINALLLQLTSYLLGNALDENVLVVNDFLSALYGGVIISIVSTLLSMFLIEDD
ncbi:phage holin family protein [Chloroflexi bacterium TSY]|nr:phage holin family protein [Chloroflexi bacterium TSY]